MLIKAEALISVCQQGVTDPGATRHGSTVVRPPYKYKIESNCRKRKKLRMRKRRSGLKIQMFRTEKELVILLLKRVQEAKKTHTSILLLRGHNPLTLPEGRGRTQKKSLGISDLDEAKTFHAAANIGKLRAVVPLP